MINYSNFEEILQSEGYLIQGFSGFSMYPTFLKDDLLIMIKCDNYELYDVVLYKDNDKYIAHRIIDIKEDYYVIRGDNTIIDEIVQKDKVLAKIDAILRNSKEIKLEYNKNFNDFNKSLKSLKYRKFKNKIKKLIKHG